jgi:VanZ family protein
MTKKIRDQSTLGYALLIYMCIVVVLITLVPFEFRMPEHFHLTWSTNFTDFFTNILLFVPVGFLFNLTRRENTDLFCLQALAFGVLLSFAVESAQVFIPGRYPQVIDVITNGFGAWLGGLIFTLLKNWLQEERAGRLFAWQLPLVGLLYLLIPLMWLNGLATGQEEARVWLLLLLGIIGAGVICSVYVNRFKHTGTFGYTKLSVFVVCWFFVSSLPLLTNFPLKILFFGIVIIFIVQILARLTGNGAPREKRFEIPTIKKLLPIYIIYLLLLAFWPTTITAGEWQHLVIFEELVFEERIVLIFRFVEFIAAFTLLGYVIAEMRGRKDEAVEKTLGWTFFIAVAAAIFTEVLKTYPTLNSINILSIVIIISACLYGAVIYRLQLAAIERREFKIS